MTSTISLALQQKKKSKERGRRARFHFSMEEGADFAGCPKCGTSLLVKKDLDLRYSTCCGRKMYVLALFFFFLYFSLGHLFFLQLCAVCEQDVRAGRVGGVRLVWRPGSGHEALCHRHFRASADNELDIGIQATELVGIARHHDRAMTPCDQDNVRIDDVLS